MPSANAPTTALILETNNLGAERSIPPTSNAASLGCWRACARGPARSHRSMR